MPGQNEHRHVSARALGIAVGDGRYRMGLQEAEKAVGDGRYRMGLQEAEKAVGDGRYRMGLQEAE